MRATSPRRSPTAPRRNGPGAPPALRDPSWLRPMLPGAFDMRTTIDKAGRLVIPAAIRDRAGLTPGTTIEISLEGTGVRLERVAPGPRLVRVGRRLVARPTVAANDRPHIDVAA